MHQKSVRLRALGAVAVACAIGVSALPTAAAAQYIGAAPPPPADLAPGTVLTPSQALARNVRILAGSPKNFTALMGAGRAALDLGDLQSAIGFFGRADDERPNDPAPKAGMGAAVIQTGDARGALEWFFRAQGLGATAAQLGTDRGLAQDLLGNFDAAQVDYRAALTGPTPDEARRRLALSQAMSGQMNEGLKTLQPLLMRRDVAARRVRAFVLALGGEQRTAYGAIEEAMPGAGPRLAPFLQQLPRLSREQKAAAVHLGVFPNPNEIRIAAAEPVKVVAAAPAPEPAKRTKVAKLKKGQAGRRIPMADPVPTPPDVVVATVAPAPTPPPVSLLPSEREPAAPQLAASTVQAPTIPAPTVAAPLPAPRMASVDRLSGIDKLLADATKTPSKAEADRALREAKLEKARKAAADRKALADKKDAAAKLAADKRAKQEAADQALADKKAKADAAKIGVAGTTWVQLAGGSNAERLATEYQRIKAKKPALFAGKSGYSTAGKDYFRLLVGPFDDATDARAFVGKLDKAGIDGFTWTRSPATLKIEKLPSK